MCKVYYYVWNVCYTTSIIILTVVAVERYIAIIHPLRARYLRRRRTLIRVCIFTWAISIAYNTPYLIYYDIISLPVVDIEFCYFTQENFASLQGLSVVNLVVWFVIPLVVIAFMYCKVGSRLCKRPLLQHVQRREHNCYQDSHSHSPMSLESSVSICQEDSELKMTTTIGTMKRSNESVNVKNDDHTNMDKLSIVLSNSFRCSKNKRQKDTTRKADRICFQKRNSERRKVIRLLVAIVTSFAVCVMPHHLKVLNHFWTIVHLPHAVDVYFSPISFIILYLNSVLNPILYALFSAKFRKAVKEVLLDTSKKRDSISRSGVTIS